jgi:hypothetical protein
MALGDKALKIIQNEYSSQIVDCSKNTKAKVCADKFLKQIQDIDKTNQLKNVNPEKILLINSSAAIFRILPNQVVLISQVV